MRISCTVFFFLLLTLGNGYSPKASRRAFLIETAATTTLLVVPSSARASLLDEFGADPNKIVPTKAPDATLTKKAESSIEPNLRSNYYYPTNKKRYLPRIKKCSDQIPTVADQLGAGEWIAVEEFANIVADDTILPLKLYTSSLTGGGTNVKVAYVKDMYGCADDFEMNQKKLVKAISRKDQLLCSEALEGMSVALTKYRSVANLDDMGDLPSVDDIRRAARRNIGSIYEKTVTERDARVKVV